MAKPEKVADVFQHPETRKFIVCDRSESTPVKTDLNTEKEAYDWAMENGYTRVVLPYHHHVGV